MIRPRKVWTVATFEFLSEVKRISYLIMTFGMPVFILAYGGFVALVVALGERAEARPRLYGVVDGAGVLSSTAAPTDTEDQIPQEIREALTRLGPRAPVPDLLGGKDGSSFALFKDEPAAVDALKSKAIAGIFLLRSDYLETGDVDAYYPEDAGLGNKKVQSSLRTFLQANLLQGHVDEKLAARVRAPILGGGKWTLQANGELTQRGDLATVSRFIVPILFCMLFLISILGTSQSLINGTAIEKENRVVDVLLSAAHADEILAGKLLGLGAAALLQVAVWLSMAGVSALTGAALLATLGVRIPLLPLAIGFLFYVPGYLLLGSLMLGSGSLGNNAKEGQQWSLVWTMLAALPMFFLGVLINTPSGTIAKVLTWIPFSAPLIVVFRLSMDPKGIAWWEIAGSFVVLLLSIWLGVRLGARLFRVGLLMTGVRLNLFDVIRQARLSR